VDSSGGSFEIDKSSVSILFGFRSIYVCYIFYFRHVKKEIERCRYAVQIKPNKKCLINLNQKLDFVNKLFFNII